MIHLTNTQIHDIAEDIDMDFVCFLNKDTGEMITMMNDEMLSDNGFSEDNEPEESWPEWQKEMYAEVNADIAKINSWKNTIRIEKPEPHESFEFMERFVDEIIPEKSKERFGNTLSGSHPFRHFKELVDNSVYREQWFAFKQKELEAFVKRVIDENNKL